MDTARRPSLLSDFREASGVRQRALGDRRDVTGGPTARDSGLPRHRLAVAERPMPVACASRNGCAAVPVQPLHLHHRADAACTYSGQAVGAAPCAVLDALA